MGDKSPKQTNAKKPHGKSIKEKRLDKKAKPATGSQMDHLTHGKREPTGQRGQPCPDLRIERCGGRARVWATTQ